MNLPRISVVIPAFNEEALLPRLLETVDVARAEYRHGRDAVEVIVGDNGSTDRTAAIAARRGARVVPVAKRVIGAVRNGGAAAASGDILAFMDADLRIHPESFNAIDDAIASGRYVGGASGVIMERWSVGIAATYAMLVPLVVLMRMDTGITFCRRLDFEAIGGYDETKRFAEDVAILLALRRLGNARGQKLVRLRHAKALASLRKFDEHGDWHYFTMILRMFFSPRRMEELVERYWYAPTR